MRRTALIPILKTMSYDIFEAIKSRVLPFYEPAKNDGSRDVAGNQMWIPGSIAEMAPEGLMSDFAQPHPVLADHLKNAKDNAPERAVIRSWSRRDPVDAALDARLLLQRLKRDGPKVQLDRDRFEVVRTHKDWTTRYSPAVYLLAGERLTAVMDRWADAVLAEIIEPNTTTV